MLTFLMTKNPRLKHLSHAGEMGYRIANYDWAKTSLGDPEYWPQSLVTTIGMMVEHKFAMYLVWGDELIQFYNDSCIEILGNKHPEALWYEIRKFLERNLGHYSSAFYEVSGW
ncbi:hypothetical protein [Peredibacter starrii]|uniref:Histidine kinase n=1 Tax=Peredibacter starrii TaxID=28202 RepID=A0AAX4HK05_9BACT|nr:hypothetical protein [Peredibacter starrii]WPU63533.1 hypothetical protein SOO65_12625 [Peredibacter starrii]